MPEPIKVAHLINHLSPAGKEMGIVKLLNRMDPQRFKGYLVVFDKVWDTLALDVEKSELIAINKKKGNDPILPFKVAKILRSRKIDILHTHAWGTLVEGILGAKLARTPVVIHGEHGTFHKTGKRKKVQNLFWRWADHRLSVSGILARNLEKTIELPENSFDTILNGVDTEKFRPDAADREAVRAELGIAADTVLIGTVGRTIKVKNHPLMIEAAHFLKDKGLPFKMVIVGDSPFYSIREEMEEKIKKYRLSDSIEFLGNRSDVSRVMNAFDIFVLPSLSEGCSNVIQEAMATGLPVIATNVGGNPELVTDNKTGFLFTSEDAADFADKMERLLLNPELRREFGRASRQDALKRFSLDVMVRAYEDYYIKALTGKNGR
ncbi:MAG TPA: glycosyltransferase [Caldithrix abyssi]|uniref:Glycosyltransferase n=1 Tax=Caldithrix abyssi TaxID=187145 RepID=A0A7V5RQ12_CALAY|nr:glycosyltransferase [Caldithrix abyssi]